MMLRSMKALLDYNLLATDGKIGAVDDFLFDDESWTVRYLVANSGGWLKGRLVLLSTAALNQPDWQSHLFPVDLTRQQIEDSPSILSDAPVARQKELELARHYNWPVYWAIDGFGGFGAAPILSPIEPTPALAQDMHEEGNPHLRSVREVRGYRVHAKDADAGHIDDLIVDDDDWVIRYAVVDTRNWLPGRKVLIGCDWIEEVSWTDARVVVGHSREEIRNCPEYDPSAPVNREYEEVLHDYYGRPRYWEPREPAHPGKSGRRR
jgi:uncharacterized protein YrrD